MAEEEKLKECFLKDYAALKPGKYDVRDLDRVKHSTLWLSRFLLHQKNDIGKACRMMDVSLSWRKEFGVNDLQESDVPLEMREKGALFFHNKNKTGNDILWFKIKETRRGDTTHASHIRRLIAYSLDMYQRAHPLAQIVALLDMTGVGLSNVDIDLTKFLITCFTTYFPGMLECLLVYDMPWIVNAVWTIVKQILSEEEQKHVIFCSRSTIQQYVARDQLFFHMGGTDAYAYQYAASKRSPSSSSGSEMVAECGHDRGEVDVYSSVHEEPVTASSGQLGGECTEVASKNGDPSALGLNCQSNCLKPSEQQPVDPTQQDEKSVDLRQRDGRLPDQIPVDKRSVSFSTIVTRRAEHTEHPSQLTLHLEPEKELCFTRSHAGCDSNCCLTIRNPHGAPFAFKVKTTDPNKFKVKPSSGVLNKNDCAIVSIVLLPGKRITSDKFLILSLQLTESTLAGNLHNVWKEAPIQQIKEHKLHCREDPADVVKGNSPSLPFLQLDKRSTKPSDTTSDANNIDHRFDQLLEEIHQLKQTQCMTVTLVVIVLIILSFILWTK